MPPGYRLLAPKHRPRPPIPDPPIPDPSLVRRPLRLPLLPERLDPLAEIGALEDLVANPRRDLPRLPPAHAVHFVYVRHPGADRRRARRRDALRHLARPLLEIGGDLVD